MLFLCILLLNPFGTSPVCNVVLVYTPIVSTVLRLILKCFISIKE
jgi:hypothetical protein